MKIIFIRHGEPNYEIDSLTEKGFREAELLSQRVARWNVTDFYCSVLGRARDTAAPSLQKTGRQAAYCGWLREFDAPILDPATGKRRIPWDFFPEYLDAHPELFHPGEWGDSPDLLTGDVRSYYAHVTGELDAMLARYGYRRSGHRYLTGADTQSDAVVVCFCHLGITCALVSHLLNMTPSQLWQGFFLAPTSVTVLGTEERTEGNAYFRCQMMGDTSHLRMGNEPVSYYGYFTEPFQG